MLSIGVVSGWWISVGVVLEKLSLPPPHLWRRCCFRRTCPDPTATTGSPGIGITLFLSSVLANSQIWLLVMQG
ncbi:hypothetical protein FCM35_KLT00753 [Carex littledalei]|uniref:Uncharacterized protein n=1 Tax=Carex littledalei TaxID=544730 RepID=A0A833RB79_9POAL|nr:hypothetical protein FCM35_KLT00753 [Carex littledalei]